MENGLTSVEESASRGKRFKRATRMAFAKIGRHINKDDILDVARRGPRGWGGVIEQIIDLYREKSKEDIERRKDFRHLGGYAHFSEVLSLGEKKIYVYCAQLGTPSDVVLSLSDRDQLRGIFEERVIPPDFNGQEYLFLPTPTIRWNDGKGLGVFNNGIIVVEGGREKVIRGIPPFKGKFAMMIGRKGPSIKLVASQEEVPLDENESALILGTSLGFKINEEKLSILGSPDGLTNLAQKISDEGRYWETDNYSRASLVQDVRGGIYYMYVELLGLGDLSSNALGLVIGELFGGLCIIARSGQKQVTVVSLEENRDYSVPRFRPFLGFPLQVGVSVRSRRRLLGRW